MSTPYSYGPPGYGGPPWPVRDPGTNGLATAALVLGILAPFGGGLVSVILGFVALSQIKKSGQRGRGRAIGGIVATAVWVVVLVAVVIVLLALTSASRDGSGQITDGGRVSTASLRPGDCVEELSEGDSIASLPAVPCTEPHRGEVFAIFDLPAGDWPGEDGVSQLAADACYERLEDYSPEAYADESVELFNLLPAERHWRNGDREVICLAYYPDGPRTGALQD